jgi:glucan biosynthesis protein C
MQEKVNRLYFMDGMRATLMSLGVVLHAGQVFNSKKTWLIYSENTSDIVMYIVSFIHAFRMPAFFIVAGYFCLFTLRKYKTTVFLSVRLKRIAIPFVVTILTLNTLQMIFLDYSGWQKTPLLEYISEGKYIGHLWFLINLFVYFLLAAFISLFKNTCELIGIFLENAFNKYSIFVFILILPTLNIFILSLNKIGFPLYSSFFKVIHTYDILIYLPYFLFGIFLAINQKILKSFSTISPVLSIIAITSSVYIIKSFSNEGSGLAISVVTEYLNVFLTLFNASLCFYFFYKFFNIESVVMRFLSDASYTVYLFHHFLVIGIGLVFIYFEVPAFLGFILLVITVLFITLSIHKLLILKNKTARHLFNGK